MDYDPRDYYDEIEAQFADEMEAMDEMEKFQREPENAEPPGYMWVTLSVVTHFLVEYSEYLFIFGKLFSNS